MRWEKGAAARLARGADHTQSHCLRGRVPGGLLAPGLPVLRGTETRGVHVQQRGAVSLGGGTSAVARGGLCGHTSPGLPARSGSLDSLTSASED